MIAGLCPPSARASARLAERVARRAAIRLGRVRRALAAPALRRAVPGGAETAASLALLLPLLPEAARRRTLHGPDLRGFLGEAELWLAVHRLAARGDSRGLFERVSRTEHLARLLPRGRVDRGFARRCLAFARSRLRHDAADLAALLLGLRLAHPLPVPLDLRLEFREEPEQGRPRRRIDLGTFQGPAGALAIAAPRRSVAARVRARLEGRTLRLRLAGGGERVLPAAGSRLSLAGDAPPQETAAARLIRRAAIPGSPILLAPSLRSSARRLTVGRADRGLGARLARSLAILRLAWPDGHREVLRRTAMVVPIRERGLVSYSLAARPGVSFINVHGKSSIDLADDLLHETAHHLLHDLQEVEALLPHGSETEEVQAFHSPWRGALRPLHGILHGAYTFLFRAELFGRILAAANDHPRRVAPLLGAGGLRFVRRERRRELRMLAKALADLRSAAREGLLSDRGRALLRAMRAWHARLVRPTR